VISLPFSFNAWSADGCRLYLLTSDFAYSGDISNWNETKEQDMCLLRLKKMLWSARRKLWRQEAKFRTIAVAYWLHRGRKK
jgi:hypothetical protein